MKGVWGLVVSHIPPQEIDEIESIIGRIIIDKNKSLWEEVDALREIVGAFLSLEIGGNLNGSDSPNTAAPSSHIFNISSNRPTSRRSDVSNHVELPESLKSHVLNVDKIREVADDLRNAIIVENSELEAEISVLHDNMDQEVDDISSKASTPRSEASRIGAHSATTILPTQCAKCAASQKQSKIRAIKALPSKASLCSCQCIPEPPRNTSRAGTGKGKFRSRLQEARDEHHFMEDVDMI